MSKRASFISSWPARRTNGMGGVLPGGATVDVAAADAETFGERERRRSLLLPLLLLLLPPILGRGVLETTARAEAGAAHRARRKRAAATGRDDRAAVVFSVAGAIEEEDASVERIVAFCFAFSLVTMR